MLLLSVPVLFNFFNIYCNLKNIQQRAEDAKAESRRRRPRIGEQKKELTAAERERIKASKMMKVDSSVWAIVNRCKIEAARREMEQMGDPFALPFKNDRERIKHYKHAFAHLTIAEAFAATYGDITVTDPEMGNNLPTSIKIGDIIPLKITSISKKGGVVFNSGSYKENFITRNNLAHYSKFADYLPLKEIRAKVIETTPKHTIVDVFTPLIEEFILPRATQPWTQNEVQNAKPIIVKNLKLVRGGYLGQAVIPTISDFVGEEFTVDAFIPGSQITLNTVEDFEQFNDAAVEAFIISYAPKPNGRGMSLVCSRKNFLRHQGNLELMKIYNMWCDAGNEWKEFSQRVFRGTVTGVLNSTKKCGAFVELPELNITGMIPLEADQLVNYKAGQEIEVLFANLDEEMTYNDAVDQMQHIPPFELENGAIKKVNIRPIFELR